VSVAQANEYLSRLQPWAMKNAGDDEAHQRTMVHPMETLRICGILLQPIMPATMKRMLSVLGIPLADRTWDHAALWHGWPASSDKQHRLPDTIPVLFPKI
jgi:methionyl-tRNA synthetase